jgi:hypothetical protein
MTIVSRYGNYTVEHTKLLLYLTKYHAMKTCKGVEAQLHVFLALGMDGG